MDLYDLTLGLPHTNRFGLSESVLLMQAGHFHWTSIARAIGKRLSALRTVEGERVYASFYYVDATFPGSLITDWYQLDDVLQFGVWLRSFKNLVVESRLIFDRKDCIRDWLKTSPKEIPNERTTQHPFLRLATVFITPDSGNARLRLTSPVGIDLSSLPVLTNAENPYIITRRAEDNGDLEILGLDWQQTNEETVEFIHEIDADRDTNGAGLVYFANFLAFMDQAESKAMRGAWTNDPVARRVCRRRIAYYGNVSTNDHVSTRVRFFHRAGCPNDVGIRYEIVRGEDGHVICRSEAIKSRQTSHGT